MLSRSLLYLLVSEFFYNNSFDLISFQFMKSLKEFELIKTVV